MLAPSTIPLGGLQGIELLYAGVILNFLDMSSKVAGAINPLQLGFAVAIAIGACGIYDDTVATLTLLYYRMTLASVVGTPFFSHEDALRPSLYRLANHGYHLPSTIKYKKTRPRTT